MMRMRKKLKMSLSSRRHLQETIETMKLKSHKKILGSNLMKM